MLETFAAVPIVPVKTRYRPFHSAIMTFVWTCVNTTKWRRPDDMLHRFSICFARKTARASPSARSKIAGGTDYPRPSVRFETSFEARRKFLVVGLRDLHRLAGGHLATSIRGRGSLRPT